MAKLKAVGAAAPEPQRLWPRDRELGAIIWPDNHSHREKWLAAVVYLRKTVGWRNDLGPQPRGGPEAMPVSTRELPT